MQTLTVVERHEAVDRAFVSAAVSVVASEHGRTRHILDSEHASCCIVARRACHAVAFDHALPILIAPDMLVFDRHFDIAVSDPRSIVVLRLGPFDLEIRRLLSFKHFFQITYHSFLIKELSESDSLYLYHITAARSKTICFAILIETSGEVFYISLDPLVVKLRPFGGVSDHLIEDRRFDHFRFPAYVILYFERKIVLAVFLPFCDLLGVRRDLRLSDHLLVCKFCEKFAIGDLAARYIHDHMRVNLCTDLFFHDPEIKI